MEKYDLTDVHEFREEVLVKLPSLLSRALANYRKFTEPPAPEDVKLFTAHQAACRGALMHVHLLIKLSKWAADKGDDLTRPLAAGELSRLVEEAEEALGLER